MIHTKTNAMNLKGGYPFWLIKDGLPHTYPKLDKSIDTDVIIMGAGISGALVRYYLAEAGIKCVTVDSRTIGLGSTCASTSLLQYEIDTPLHELTGMVGRKNAERAYQLCGRAITALGKLAKKLGVSEFEYRKSLFFAAYKKDVEALRQEFDARKKAGFELEYLEPEKLHAEFGFEAPGALLSNLAAQTNAYEFTHKLLQHKIKTHAVFDRTPIVKIKHHKNGVTLETENGLALKAKKLVYATGYEVVDFIDRDIVKLLSTYAVVSEQYPHSKFWKDNVLIWNTANPYLYMRTTADNRIIVGGRDEEFQNPKRRDALLIKKTMQLTADFQKLFPDLHFKPEFSWTGTFGATKDGLPYIGPYKPLPNSYFALGFGGNGITFSLIAAEIIRDLIMGKENADTEIFVFGR